MSFKIITISREFGSGGRFIGEQIAQKCGIEFYDKKIIEHVAKELGISEQIVANHLAKYPCTAKRRIKYTNLLTYNTLTCYETEQYIFQIF